ncbi:MAG: S-methyl-5-thioribose-1-phosphate isomerase [Candidatus Gastranaerophilales bacterium]|nr:S-methyl-5-thioribose-1-phosphate isomerase [Candidatus Gastranaerophilales bacterium]
MNSAEKTIEWIKTSSTDGFSRMIDQTIIPYEYKKVDIKSSEEMYDAIKTMIVRGAPAIGIAGAHGVVLGAIENINSANFVEDVKKVADYLNSSRPTAVNLNWALKKQIEVLENNKEKTNSEIIELLVENAIKLEDEDIQINKKIGEYGSEIIPKGATILTHCNAGALATVGWGTALGVVRSAFEKDKTIKVFADETRPRGQGARLTTYELTRDGIDTTLITDGMGAYFMNKKMIDVVVVGADRIALNGDSANKIGTYMVAIAAKYHNIPFYIAAPKSTIDPTIKTGDEIVIELRNKEEVTIVNDKPICTDKVNVINPSFDVTPNELITGIITEYGIFKPNEIYKLFG